jgi:hypothetical protein
MRKERRELKLLLIKVNKYIIDEKGEEKRENNAIYLIDEKGERT